MNKRLPLALMALATATPAFAQITQDEREVLEAFYLATNGDEWFRNDGWLEPGTAPCEWHGVVCEHRFELDRDIVRRLELPDNNLTGTLDTRIFEIVHETLDLSGNRIGGSLDRLPGSPGRVDLSGNELGGTLPVEFSERADALSGTSRPSSNWYLDLSSNLFEGGVPPDWKGPKWLSLANNRFEGVPLALLEGSGNGLMSDRFLDLSNNLFSGGLPVSMMQGGFLQHNGPSRWGGGINLCWNDWAIPESVEFREWLLDHHVGGDFEQCLFEERQSIGPAVSGSWYDRERSGEGISVLQLDNGSSLIYFFTFDEHGNQQWLFNVTGTGEFSVDWNEMLRTRGRFNEGLLASGAQSPPVEVRGSFRIDRLGSDRILAERVYIDETGNACLAVYPPPLGCFGDSLSDRLEYQRLSQLAGTNCDNQSEFQKYSGAWYDPERSGEGFIVEVLPDERRVIVYWFTHAPDESGRQAWMIGDGQFKDPQLIVDPPTPFEESVSMTLYQPTGAHFGPRFDSQDLELVEWGELEIRFFDENSAEVIWDSDIEGYGSGQHQIERLARPLLADCSGGDSE